MWDDVCQCRVWRCLHSSLRSLAIRVRGSTWSRPITTSPIDICEDTPTMYFSADLYVYNFSLYVTQSHETTKTLLWSHHWRCYYTVFLEQQCALPHHLWCYNPLLGAVCHLYFDIEFNLDVNAGTPPLPVLETFIEVCTQHNLFKQPRLHKYLDSSFTHVHCTVYMLPAECELHAELQSQPHSWSGF